MPIRALPELNSHAPMPPSHASPAAISAACADLPGWRLLGATLRCTYCLPTFESAVAFTDAIGALATEIDHHPEWTVRFREVDITTTTHDVGSVTERDLTLAGRIRDLAEDHDATPRPGDATARPGDLWTAPGHFYSPIPDAAEIEADAERLFAPGLRELPAIDLRLPQQLVLARELARFYGEEDFSDEPRPDRRFCLAQDYFPFGDAFTYHALLRHLQPRRVMEIGAGWSSAVLLDTDERFLGNRIACTFVEPYPDRLLSLLRPEDAERTRLLRQRVQDVDRGEFEALEAGDILFIDSSHVVKTGSDVAHLLFEVLPCLRPGVWVHFHDVHKNFEYAEPWVREGRAWNEAYFLRAFLMHNRDWILELHGATLAEHAADALLPLMPKIAGAVGGSLWLRKA